MKAPWLVAFAVAACGGKAEPLEQPTPIERPVEPPPDALEAPEPIAEELPVVAQPPAIAAPCRGERLDLKQLVKSEACVVHAAAQPLPATIAIAFEPRPLKMKAGAQGTATLVLTNTAAAETTLLLPHACGRLVEVTYEMLASNGDRVDLAEGGCGEGRGCGPKTIGVALPPNGQLRLDFQLIARIEKFDAQCKGARAGGPVPKGTYDLKVYSAFPDQQTKVTIY